MQARRPVRKSHVQNYFDDKWHVRNAEVQTQVSESTFDYGDTFKSVNNQLLHEHAECNSHG